MRNTRRVALPLAVMIAGMIVTGAGVALAAGSGADEDTVSQQASQFRGNPPGTTCAREERGLPPTCETTPPPPGGSTSTTPPVTTTTTETTTTSETTTTTPVTTTTAPGITTTTTTPGSTTMTTPVATTSPAGQGSSNELAFTGTNSNTGVMVAVGVLLVVSGVLMLVVRRRPAAEK